MASNLPGELPADEHAASVRLDLRLPPRLVLGVATAIIAILVIGALSLGALREQQRHREETLHTLDTVAAINAVLSSMKDAETGQRGYLITGREDYLEPYLQAQLQVLPALDSLQVLVEAHPDQLRSVAALRQLIERRLDVMQQTVDLQRAGQDAEALGMVNSGQGKQLMDGIRSAGGTMLAQEQGRLAARTQSMESSGRVSTYTVLGGLGLLLALVTVAGFLNARDVRHREIESWLRAGQARLSGDLQGEQRLEVLGESVLRFMTRQLDAPAGAFYTVEAGRLLRRVAGFALVDDAPAQFALGEGLAGEAARSNRVMQLDVVPEHLRLHSGVVSGVPARVVLVPMLHNGRVNAVLELALARSPDPAQAELLERSRAAIGTAVNSSMDRSRLEELLQETQRQSEELQAQQEELRVANEELQGQSEALKSSQARLEQQQVELEQTNSQLEEQTRSLEEHADQLARGEAELRARSEELQRSNDYKSEFLANMSHELRTPLNSSLILARLLAENKAGNLTDEQVRFAHTILSSGNDLLALINDILDLSKIEAGKMEIQRENVQPVRLAESLREGFGEIARNKGLRFEVVVEPEVPARIETDSQRVMQVLRNLLSNAFKFTASGEVAVRIATEGPAGARRILFAVRDSGIGIAPEHQQTIFEAFRQADGSTHRRYGGTGLGLSISRDLAHLLGGEVTLQSSVGAGSTFTLSLPERMPENTAAGGESRVISNGGTRIAPRPVQSRSGATETSRPSGEERTPPAGVSTSASPAVREPEQAQASGGRNLLIIEDDPAFAAILRDLAGEHGFQAVVAHTAREGLEEIKSQRISAVLLDMHLPDRAGLAVLDELKRSPHTRHVPVHVVSVADYSHEALSRGAVGYALKPVDREQVAEALRRLDARLSPGVRRVLVVEDDARQRESVRALLASEGVEIVPAETAARALELLSRNTFDCMVLDLNLPDLSGYELLEKMGELEGVSYPPVIVYTGRSLGRDEEQRLRRFSRAIIVKDARSPERLLDEVTLFLHQVEAELPPERQRMLREARDREAAFDGRRILVVEDDVRNIFALSKVLEPRGARIDIARNGREALEHLERTRGSADAPDLVLMDVMMPEMDGLSATREIRRDAQWKRLPIIALTAKAMRDDQEKCLAAGANDYLAKPLDIERLLSLVRVWMPQ